MNISKERKHTDLLQKQITELEVEKGKRNNLFTSYELSKIPMSIEGMNKKLLTPWPSVKPQKRNQVRVSYPSKKLNHLIQFFTSCSAHWPQKPEQPHLVAPLQQGLVQCSIVGFSNHFPWSIQYVTYCKVFPTLKDHQILLLSHLLLLLVFRAFNVLTLIP